MLMTVTKLQRLLKLFNAAYTLISGCDMCKIQRYESADLCVWKIEICYMGCTKKQTTCVEWSCIISKVSRSENGSRRSRKMESYKENRNAINLLHSRPLEEEGVAHSRCNICNTVCGQKVKGQSTWTADWVNM